MNISSPPSSRRTSVRIARAERRPHSSGFVATILALLAGALGCAGGTSADEPAEPGVCVSNADCAEGQICESAACVLRTPLDSRIADSRACAVVSCPASDPTCCSTAAASATGNQNQAYSPQLQMLRDIDFDAGEVRADFRFDAPDQQGWVTFQLGAELDLSKLEFTGWRDGVSDHVLSLNTRQRDGGGCAFAFDLDPRPAAAGSGMPLERYDEVEFRDDSFCYDGGNPGRAVELAFAIFSTEPGPASLAISNITLIAE